MNYATIRHIYGRSGKRCVHILKTAGLGLQDFEKVIRANAFYIDKTKFISEWWTSEDDVTLITRPRRFGKTLMLSTVEKFFSVRKV